MPDPCQRWTRLPSVVVAVEGKAREEQSQAPSCRGAAGGHFPGRGNIPGDLRLPGSRTSAETSEVRLAWTVIEQINCKMSFSGVVAAVITAKAFFHKSFQSAYFLFAVLMSHLGMTYINYWTCLLN